MSPQCIATQTTVATAINVMHDATTIHDTNHTRLSERIRDTAQKPVLSSARINAAASLAPARIVLVLASRAAFRTRSAFP
jgi:hypothetical protein